MTLERQSKILMLTRDINLMYQENQCMLKVIFQAEKKFTFFNFNLLKEI